jgi:hypothetical protein
MALKGHSICPQYPLGSESTAEPLGSSRDEDDAIAGRHADTDAVPQSIPPDADADPDISRQAGDSSLYKMYLESVGWPVATAFVVSIIIDVVVSKMPRSCLIIISIRFVRLADFSFRDLAATLDRTRDGRR